MTNSVERVARQAFGSLAADWPENTWLDQAADLASMRLIDHTHGDLPRWLSTIESLPAVQTSCHEKATLLALGENGALPDRLRDTLMQLHPWRKGPMSLGGITIDTEWRSDWKWDRIARHIDLNGQRVLDIGCGNGYFGYRMLGAGAQLVVGIDPTLLFVMQWLACRHFAGDLPNYVLPLGVEDLPPGQAGFDRVFSMGVLYHRRDPHEHLRRIRSLLRPGGLMVLETLVLPDSRRDDVLVPEGRYAAMRNVWAVPGTDCLQQCILESGFTDSQLVDVTRTSVEEQRSTSWMHFESLQKALDSVNPGLTREGHPAPRRAMLIATA